MTDKNLKLKKLEKENLLFKTILDRIHEGVSVLSCEGIYTFYNRGVEICEGLDRDKVLGRHDRDVYPYDPKYSFYDNIVCKVIESGQPLLEKHCKYSLPNNRMCNILIDSYPFFFNGKLDSVFNIGRNVQQDCSFFTRTQELGREILREESRTVKKEHTRYTFSDIVGNCERISKALDDARKIAVRNSPVLIYGDTGTGKELFAQGIHNSSFNRKGPFVAVNCAAIPESLLESLMFGTIKGAFTGAVDMPGLFEQAENGTLFLDEIDSMPIFLQAKFLRVVQEKMVRRIGDKLQRPVNCRFISAMNSDPLIALKKKKIREDLFFRIATVTLYVPTLKERKEDLYELTQFFIKKYNVQFGLYIRECSEELLKGINKYHWPGNVRELENTIESGMNFVEESESILGLKHLPVFVREKFLNVDDNLVPLLPRPGKLNDILYDAEKKIIAEALKRNKRNITKTAEELGILRQTLNYKLKKFGLNK